MDGQTDGRRTHQSNRWVACKMNSILDEKTSKFNTFEVTSDLLISQIFKVATTQLPMEL